MAIELRPYQIQGMRDIFAAWRNGERNVLFQMHTGTGKTTLFSEIVKRGAAKGRRILLVVHRIELVEQIVDRLRLFDIDPGVILAGMKPESEKLVQVASIQTLNRRRFPPADLVIIDEAHHATATSYLKLWDIYPEAHFLGVTATPVRFNGDGFQDLFDVLICSESLKYFVDNKFLVPIRHFVCSTPDLSGVEKLYGDYNKKQLKSAVMKQKIMADLVESYQKYAPGKKMILFAVDIDHSISIMQRFIDVGIPSAHIDAETPRDLRREVLNRFKSGEIRVLCNVNIVSEGFDVPDCEVVQLARPTRSLALYIQQVGRCMRPAPGKEAGIVLDNAGCWLEHGLSNRERHWVLKGRRKTMRDEGDLPEAVLMDDQGFIRGIPSAPEECEGLELVEMDGDMGKLLIFEIFYAMAIGKEHKPIAAYFKYLDHLKHYHLEITKSEIEYCKKRMGEDVSDGFWYHQLKNAAF